MDIHPIVVHFPIALIFIYAVLELLPIKKLRTNTWIKVKAFLIFIGGVSAFIASAAGETAEHLKIAANPGNTELRNIIELHSTFAGITTWVSIVIAFGYLIKIASEKYRIYPFLKKIARIIVDTPIIYLFAFVVLIAIICTGALGGAIVYGKDFDFISSFLISKLG